MQGCRPWNAGRETPASCGRSTHRKAAAPRPGARRSWTPDRRQLVPSQPRPHRAREAGVVHRAVPATAAEISASSRARAPPRRGRRTAPPSARLTPRATSGRDVAGRVGRSCSRRRYASRRGRRAAQASGARPMTNPGTSARVAPRFPSRASGGTARQTSRRTRARRSRRRRRTRAPAPRGCWAAANHSCPEPTWFVVRSPSTRIPCACAGADEGDKGVLAPEQRVDAIERGGVVPMRAPRREHGREVEDVHAERRHVVEVLLDSGKIAAEHSNGVSRTRAPWGARPSPAESPTPAAPLRRERGRVAKRSGKTW